MSISAQRNMKEGSYPILRIVKLSERAFVPVRSSADAAGFDLCSAYDYKISPNGGRICAKTDIQVSSIL